MKTFLPQWDSNPGTSASEANSQSVALLFEKSIERLNVNHVLPEPAIKIYLHRVPRGVVVKCFVVCYILLTLDSQ